MARELVRREREHLRAKAVCQPYARAQQGDEPQHLHRSHRPGVLERTAGATTDIQDIIHQGFTRYGATFWVGANALARKRALEDIAVVDVERGYPIRKFIQDRTLIEDTESTVDLIDRGWQL